MKKRKPEKYEYLGLKEKWEYVYINGEKTKYQVSNLGEIRNTKRNNKMLEQVIDKYGYNQVCLSHKGKHYSKTVHSLVARAFIPNPENKPQVNHIDGRKDNNWILNLEWSTYKENVIHAYEHGLHENNAIGKNHGMNVYSEDNIEYVCQLLQESKLSISEISRITNVPKHTIHDIRAKKYWNHISDKYDVERHSSKKVRGINLELQEKIIELAKCGLRVKDIRTQLSLPYSDKLNARISYYVKKYN